jgi:transcriptional regulator with PAS, ATPase and Fis domain
MIPDKDMHSLRSLSRAAKGGTLDPERLAVKAYEMGSEACHKAATPAPIETLNLIQLEQVAIREALNRTQNRIEAAKLLGIGKTTLYRKLKEYGLSLRCDLSECPNCGKPLPRYTAPQAA